MGNGNWPACPTIGCPTMEWTEGGEDIWARRTHRYKLAFSRHEMPEFWLPSRPHLKKEGAGRTGCRLTPTTPAPKKCTRMHRVATGGAGNIPALPTRWFDRLWRALPGDEFLLASVASRIGSESEPVGSTSPPQSLTVATTAGTTHFFRTWTIAVVLRADHRSRVQENRPARVFAPAKPASTAPRSTSRDDRDTPLCRAGLGRQVRQFRISVNQNISAVRA